ncbi:MAG: DNA-processing protein DprA [Chitinophagales bacterium]
MTEKMCLVSMVRIPGLGPQKIRKVRNETGSYQSAWKAPHQLWQNVCGAEIANNIVKLRTESEPERILDEAKGYVNEIITELDDNYPDNLKHIYAAPLVLFCIGNAKLLGLQAVAMVGSRRATPYGRRVARQLGKELAGAGLVIVSGMARGIDAESHWGCLEAHGMTIGVLGTGPDIVYPKENRELFNRVSAEGLLLSEFWPGTPGEPKNFPIRNRLISGLSRGLVVVEAQEKSGAMITVEYALEQGRDVFAVPGPITSEYSKGTNFMLKEGARIVTCANDVLEELGVPKQQNQQNIKTEKGIQGVLIEYIGFEPVNIDWLINVSGLAHGEIAAELLQLEVDGIISSLPGNYYVRR